MLCGHLDRVVHLEPALEDLLVGERCQVELDLGEILARLCQLQLQVRHFRCQNFRKWVVVHACDHFH